MCAASRLARALFAAGTLSGTAVAQAPGISGPDAPPAAPVPPAAEPVAPTPAPPAPAPTFTPSPAPVFTPAPPVPAASAPPPPVFAPAPAPVSGARPPAADPSKRGPRWTDAHVDRVVFVPTAETHPSGTVYLSDYELAVLQVGFAASDHTQLSLTFTPFGLFQKDPLLPLDLSLKAVVLRQDRVRIAAIASTTGFIGLNEQEAFFGRFGAVTQLCFDRDCYSSANVAADFVFVGALLLGNGAGFVFRTGDHFAFLLEAHSLIPISRGLGEANALGMAGGIRFSGRRLGLDLTVEAPFVQQQGLPPLVPFVAFTYRFLP